MLDTTKWRQDLPNDNLDFARDWKWTRKYGITEFYKDFPIKDNPFCSLKITAASRFRKVTIEPEVSLPKLIYGNNIEMLTLSDMQMAFDAVADLVFANTGIDFDPFTADLSKVAIGQNWKMVSDSHVHSQIAAARCSDYSRRMRGEIWQDDIASVYIRNKGKRVSDVLRLYSKFDETAKLVKNGLANHAHLEQAQCVLRLERELHSSVLKLKGITAQKLFNPQIAEKLLIESMENFGLNKEQAGRDERVTKLRDYCTDTDGNLKSTTYRNLRSTLASVDDIGTADKIALMRHCEMSEPTFYEHRRNLKAAGVWLSRANRETLPPLPAPKFPA